MTVDPVEWNSEIKFLNVFFYAENKYKYFEYTCVDLFCCIDVYDESHIKADGTFKAGVYFKLGTTAPYKPTKMYAKCLQSKHDQMWEATVSTPTVILYFQY